MSGGGVGAMVNVGGLQALLEAAKFVEEQELKLQQIQEKRTVTAVEVLPSLEKELLMEPFLNNGQHVFNATPTQCTTPPPQSSQPRPGPGTREVHNKLEKNRRAHLKECFEILKKQIPAAEEKKASNLSILHSAIRYIQVLLRKERELEHEMERLARDKISFQQKLANLKKDLSAQWDHIDFSKLLPEGPEILRPNVRCTSELESAVLMSDADDISSHLKCGGTLYSSTSSLSSASPLQNPQTDLPHRLQVVSPTTQATTPSLIVSPTIQLVPPSTLRMLQAETHLLHPHLASTKPSSILTSSGLSHVMNQSLIVSQPTGQVILATPSQLGAKIYHQVIPSSHFGKMKNGVTAKKTLMMTTPLLKSVGPLPINSTTQFLVKPMVVVSSPSTVQSPTQTLTHK